MSIIPAEVLPAVLTRHAPDSGMDGWTYCLWMFPVSRYNIARRNMDPGLLATMTGYALSLLFARFFIFFSESGENTD